MAFGSQMSWNPPMWYQKYFDHWSSFCDLLQTCKSKIVSRRCSESILLSLLWKDPDSARLWNSCHNRYTLAFHLSFFSQSTKLSETLGPAKRVFAANKPQFSGWYYICELFWKCWKLQYLIFGHSFSVESPIWTLCWLFDLRKSSIKKLQFNYLPNSLGNDIVKK